MAQRCPTPQTTIRALTAAGPRRRRRHRRRRRRPHAPRLLPAPPRHGAEAARHCTCSWPRWTAPGWPATSWRAARSGEFGRAAAGPAPGGRGRARRPARPGRGPAADGRAGRTTPRATAWPSCAPRRPGTTTRMLRWLRRDGLRAGARPGGGVRRRRRLPGRTRRRAGPARRREPRAARSTTARPRATTSSASASSLADVRAMRPEDLPQIVPHRPRRSPAATATRTSPSKLGEAMDDSAIRVSLTARLDGAIVGFLMARADLGDFGRTEPVAVLDTIGVDPAYAHRGVGHALVSQLFANLGALRIDRVETVVAPGRPAAAGLPAQHRLQAVAAAGLRAASVTAPPSCHPKEKPHEPAAHDDLRRCRARPRAGRRPDAGQAQGRPDAALHRHLRRAGRRRSRTAFGSTSAEQGGKLGGREIEFVKVDDESDPAKATDNVNKLIKRDNVDVHRRHRALAASRWRWPRWPRTAARC